MCSFERHFREKNIQFEIVVSPNLPPAKKDLNVVVGSIKTSAQ